MKKLTVQPLSSYIFRLISFSLLIMAAVTLTAIISFGLHTTYKSELASVHTYSQILAQSAGVPHELGKQLYDRQKQNILDNKSVIHDIEFHSIDKNQEFEQSVEQSTWWVLLTKDRHHIIENVVLDKALIHNSSYLTLSSSDFVGMKDKSLLGYVTVVFDVKKLREEWFAQNLWLLISICIFYVFIATTVYRTSRIRREVSELNMIAKFVINSDDIFSLPMSMNTLKIFEYNQIQQACLYLIDKYSQVNEKYQRLKEDEKQFKQQKSSFSIQRTQFQNLITHELKSSLNSIVGGLQLLSRQYLSEEQQDALSVIRRGSSQLDFILNQIIELNKIEKGQVTVNQVEFNPLQLIADVIAEYQLITEKKEIELTSDITHMEHTLEGDVDKIKNILQIVLDNAVKYTNKGHVEIQSHLQHFDNSTRWTIKIKDTGVGIEEKYLEDVFTPFFQVDNISNRQHEGVGVGLTLAKQLTQLLQANLTLTSHLDEGTEVELIIPLFEKSQMLDRQLLEGINIVCFQSNQNKRLVSDLEEYGANHISLFHNSEETLEYLSRHRIDVFIIATDVEEKVAIRLSKQLREVESNHRILVVWLYLPEEVKHTPTFIESIGVDISVPMPYKTREVVKTIREWLE